MIELVHPIVDNCQRVVCVCHYKERDLNVTLLVWNSVGSVSKVTVWYNVWILITAAHFCPESTIFQSTSFMTMVAQKNRLLLLQSYNDYWKLCNVWIWLLQCIELGRYMYLSISLSVWLCTLASAISFVMWPQLLWFMEEKVLAGNS